MTAVREPMVQRRPRTLVRVAWALHRALKRVSQGRLGLSQPEPSGRWSAAAPACHLSRSQRRKSVEAFESHPQAQGQLQTKMGQAVRIRALDERTPYAVVYAIHTKCTLYATARPPGGKVQP